MLLLICALAAVAAPVPLLQESMGLMGPVLWLISAAPGQCLVLSIATIRPWQAMAPSVHRASIRNSQTGSRDTSILDRSGGGGFVSYVAFVPGLGVGVFVAVDRVDFGMFLGLVQAADGQFATLTTR